MKRFTKWSIQMNGKTANPALRRTRGPRASEGESVRWPSACISSGCKYKFNRADVGRSGLWIVARIEVKSSQHGISSVWIEIENVTDRQCQKIYATLDSLLSTERQVSDAVAKAFQLAIELCPGANPSDLWHHLIYRHLLDRGFSDQRWKRVSGFALERALVNIYAPAVEWGQACILT